MIWLLSLWLAASPDGGQHQESDGIVRYGVGAAPESFGPSKRRQHPARSTLDVTSAGLTVRGRLAEAPIRDVADQWHTRIDECARDRLDRTFVLELDVDREGFVTAGTAKSSPADGAFDACVTGLLRDWLFAQATDKKPSHIHYPMTLAPTARQ